MTKSRYTYTIRPLFPVFLVITDDVLNRFHLLLEILAGEQLHRWHILERCEKSFLVHCTSLTYCKFLNQFIVKFSQQP